MSFVPKVCCAGEPLIEFAPAENGTYTQGIAGDTLNTAVYLRRAGVGVQYFSCVGDDAFSADIVALLREEGIDHSTVAVKPGRQPGLYVIHNDADGERRFSYWRNESPARELFDHPVQLDGLDAFYFSGITLAVCRSGLANLLQFLVSLRERHCKVIFDPNFRPALWDDIQQARDCYRSVLPWCDTVLPTLDDDNALWGFDSVSDCYDFYCGFGIEELVIKTDALCVYGYLAKERCRVQAERIKALDTTGAGDAFAGAYVASRMRGERMEEAILSGQALAAKVVMHRGAIIPKS